MDINSINVIGRLVKDAELSYSGSGNAIVNFSIAVDHMKKKDGTPMSAASPKQMSCLCVRFKKTLVLPRGRSLGTGIYAAILDLLP